MKMLSLKPHLYAGRRFNAGDEFECRGQSDRRLLIALGRAKDAAPVVAALLRAPQLTPAHQSRASWDHLTPTGVVLTEGDAEADLHGLPRPDNHNRSSWVENEPVAESLAPEQAADYFADGVVTFTTGPEISPRTGKPKRAYKRRDMVAE